MIAAAVAVLVGGAIVVWRWRRLSIERRALARRGGRSRSPSTRAACSSTLPDPKKVIEDVAEALGTWTYALVGAMAFLETGAFVGLVAPGETIVIAGGVIAGQGEIDIWFR